MKRFLVALAVFSALPLVAHAASVEQARQMIDKLGADALGTITDKSLDKDKKQTRLERLFTDTVDIDWVGKFVLGRFWRTATPEQRSRYMHEYQTFITKHYAGRFTEYSEGSYKITDARDLGDGQVSVTMEIKGADMKDPVLVDYLVHTDEGRLKIYDVVVEGVSLITTQRSEFASVVSQQGLDKLIDDLAHKTQVATNGTK